MTAAPVSRAAGTTGRRSAPVALVALVFIVATLSLYGAELAAGAFRAGDAPAAPAIGTATHTSFGTVTVEHAQTIDGLTSRDMWNGMTHGIQDLVATDAAQVAVAVYLVNAGARSVPVDPAQFRLAVEGRAESAAPTGGTILPVSLRPGAGIRGTLVFVVPLGGARASVVYLDPAGPPVTIPVGSLDAAPAPAPEHTEGAAHE